MPLPKHINDSIVGLTQEEFDNELMADLPISFGNSEINQKLDAAIERIKNGEFIEVQPGQLDNFLASL